MAAQGDCSPHFKKLMTIKDDKKAEKLAQDRVNATVDVIAGAERTTLTEEITDLDKTDQRQEEEIKKARKELSKMDSKHTEYDKRAQETPDMHQRDIRKILDYVLAALCFAGGGISLIASMLAMYTLVTSAGIMAIVENPSLAWPFCVPLGLGAIALEFFKRTLKTHQGKRLYAKLIYGICASLMIAWIILAAKVFGSMADRGFDPAMLLEGSGDDPLMSVYTTVQLFLEFFIGCALFMTTGDLIGRHSKTREVPNDDYLNELKRIEAMEADNKKIKQLKTQKKSRLHDIDSTIKLYVSDQMADYEKLRAQFS